MPCPIDISRLKTRMRDYVEWLGLMAVSGSLAVLINTVLWNGTALAHDPVHPSTLPILATEVRAWSPSAKHP